VLVISDDERGGQRRMAAEVLEEEPPSGVSNAGAPEDVVDRLSVRRRHRMQ